MIKKNSELIKKNSEFLGNNVYLWNHLLFFFVLHRKKKGNIDIY